jgi:hypothetical protein
MYETKFSPVLGVIAANMQIAVPPTQQSAT